MSTKIIGVSSKETETDERCLTCLTMMVLGWLISIVVYHFKCNGESLRFDAQRWKLFFHFTTIKRDRTQQRNQRIIISRYPLVEEGNDPYDPTPNRLECI